MLTQLFRKAALPFIAGERTFWPAPSALQLLTAHLPQGRLLPPRWPPRGLSRLTEPCLCSVVGRWAWGSGGFGAAELFQGADLGSRDPSLRTSGLSGVALSPFAGPGFGGQDVLFCINLPLIFRPAFPLHTWPCPLGGSAPCPALPCRTHRWPPRCVQLRSPARC